MTDTKTKILEVLAKPAKSLDQSKTRDDAIRAILKNAPAEAATSISIRGTVSNPPAAAAKPSATAPAANTISRDAFSKLSPAEKMAFVKAGGRLTDGPQVFGRERTEIAFAAAVKKGGA